MPTVVAEAPEVDAFAAGVMHAGEIAIDIESDGMHHYRPRVCTLQCASSNGAISIVDTLAVPVARAALVGVLGADGPMKIVHDVAYDARLLAREGVRLARVFDTSIAARFLGSLSTGLAPLLAARVGVEVSKAMQHHDWSVRPLDERAVAYLAGDVAHLPALAESLRVEAEARDVLVEIEDECEYVLANANADDGPERRPAWLRVPRAADQAPLTRAVLRELAIYREERARTADRPVGRMMSNEVIMGIAKLRPREVGQLSQFRRGTGCLVSQSPREVLELVARGVAAKDAPADEVALEASVKPSRDETELRRRRERALSKWRTTVAGERELDPQVVLPGHCLHEIARTGAATIEDIERVPGIGRRRVARDGAAIVSVVAGLDP